MKIIQDFAELAAIGGGDGEPGEITCTAGTSGANCTVNFNLDRLEEFAFGTFDTLQGWGSDLGIWVYDSLHGTHY